MKASGRRFPQLHVPAGVPCVIHPITRLSPSPLCVLHAFYTFTFSLEKLECEILCFFFFLLGVKTLLTTESLSVLRFCGGDPFVYLGTQLSDC